MSSKGIHKDIDKYFNKLFGIQKTVGNIGNTWKNQINAIKSVASAVGSAAKGEENTSEKLEMAAGSIDVMQYGDRTAWIEKADQALSAYGG